MKFAHLPSIFLVGPMGAGKTTIGKLLAKHLKREFVDCDWYIADQAGTDIPWIFAKEGEVGFRQRETEALKVLVSMPNAVIATGGGAVTRAENRELLKRGLVIFLDANVDTQLLRTKKDTNRPLLQTENPRAVLEKLYQERRPLYLEVADMVIMTGKSYPKQMLLEIIEALEKYHSIHYK
ncbi:shikimate kinase [Moraxella oblonga]|uniref:shikimate kinase n=1 Tax=Moraxella oblonga TaxID=200413 RepID=UPI0008360F8D|nr:shikimate kinase [Moraxella oblonga]